MKYYRPSVIAVNSGGGYPHCVRPTYCRIPYRDLEHGRGEFFFSSLWEDNILFLVPIPNVDY